MTLPDESRDAGVSPAEIWTRTRGLVEELLALPPAARDAFLFARCGDDDGLRARVERLVAACERTGDDWSFLARPAGELAAPLLSVTVRSESAHIFERLNTLLADRYRIERELGAGGMATVYLGHDLRHGRQVAIKVLHPEISAMLGVERFLSEIKTTAGLQHPNILTLFDSGSAGGLLFYVMPLVDGETLRARLKREKQLPVADALRIATEIAGAIEYAHRRGVIHRDIKPENILLGDGRPVIADFGIALAVQSADVQRMTQPGRSLGTPQYMSPEQTTGDQEITPRSDIYALGAVTYEMLVGEPPFTGATVQQVVARVRSEEPRSIGTLRKHVPPNVEAAVAIALEKTPADRFVSAAAFAHALGDPAFRGMVSANTGATARSRLTFVSLVTAVVALAVVAAVCHATADRPEHQHNGGDREPGCLARRQCSGICRQRCGRD
jgi:serine/threonine-protein kinase